MGRLCTLSLVVGLLVSGGAHAQFFGQEGRYELGRRLRAFEIAWDQHKDEAARKRAVAHLRKAVTSFFTGQAGEAGRNLDLARLALLSEQTPAQDVVWAESLVCTPATRLLEKGKALTVTLDHFYKKTPDVPKGAKLAILLKRANETVLREECEIGKRPQSLTLATEKLPEGDYSLETEVLLEQKVLARSSQMLSVAGKLTERLKQLETAIATLPQETTSERTVAGLVEVLSKLATGKTLETDYPGARLLTEAETLLPATRGKQTFYGPEKPGQFWLWLAAKNGSAPVRIQVPKMTRPGKVPVVVALHGAGGSENMFFDGYGNGAIARQCAERGWFLVATRNGLSAGVLEELARWYPLDLTKVVLVGHSMGAAQAVALASREPKRYLAVAALGGGGRIGNADGLKQVGFFVGVGTEDFARAGARSLKNSLEKAGVNPLRFKEYENIEHLVIVQYALSDVFAFFDEILKR